MQQHNVTLIQSKGFTLIELLVVLTIIGIIVSTAVLSMSTGDISAQMDVEMRRIYTLINLAREESMLQGHEYALTVAPDHYGFEVHDDKGWEPITNDKLLRDRKIQVGMELALVVENVEIKLSESEKTDNTVIKPARVYILSSGEMSAFELILRSSDEKVQYRLRADEDGKMQILAPGELG